MNNSFNMWTPPPPYCQSRTGFNNPPVRPSWSPHPNFHMPPGDPRFLSMYPVYPNSFCQSFHPMKKTPPPKFAQHKFHNGFNMNQQSSVDQSIPSFQYGSFQPNNHKQTPYYKDKKLSSQNQPFKSLNYKKVEKKQNKRDLPENNAFYCDICDRGFKTNEKLIEHIDAHMKCKEEGCSYVAAPKLVQLHVKNQHNTGMAKKIWNIETQEDIAKWIAERKKNFPTAVNIEKKKALEAEKKARGEVLNEKQFYHRPYNQMQKRKGRYGQWWKNQKFNDSVAEGLSPEKKKKLVETEKNEVNNTEICDKNENVNTTESSDPLSTILYTNSETPSNDTDFSEENKPTSPSKSVHLPSSLKAIQTIYDSDEDNVNGENNANENSEPSTIPQSPSTIPQSPSTIPQSPSTISQSRSNATELKDGKNSSNHQQRRGKSERLSKLKEIQEFAKSPWHSKVFKREKPTLLEKLLAKEIRHERNVILQCIQYIVINNFFEKTIPVSPGQ